MQGRVFHHLYLRGNFQQDLFFDDDDFIQAINRLALSAKATDTSIWAFAYLDNHYHLIVETGDKTNFMHHYRISTSYYHRKKYYVGGMLGCRRYGSGVIADPKDDNGEDLKDAISYVLRNVKRHQVMDDFYNYRWSSIRLYFDEPKSYEPMDVKEIKLYLPYPYELPEGYHIDDSGNILLQDFVNVDGVEELFGCKRDFHDYLSMPSRRETEAISKENAAKEKRLPTDRKKKECKTSIEQSSKKVQSSRISDNVIAQFITSNLNLVTSIDSLSPKSIRQMTTNEKVEMALIASQHFPNQSIKQLSRILGIPATSLKRKLGKAKS